MSLVDFSNQPAADQLSAQLAHDLASGIWPDDEVLLRHGVEEGAELLQTNWFRSMVEAARREWTAASNTPERIRLKAALILEETLPTMFTLINNVDATGPSRVAAFKEIKEISGVAPRSGDAGELAAAPQVNIYLGAPGDPLGGPPTISVSATVPGSQPLRTGGDAVDYESPGDPVWGE